MKKLLILIFIFFGLKALALENTVKHVDNEGVIDTLDRDYTSGYFFFNEGLHRGTIFESTDKYGNKVLYNTKDDRHHFSLTANWNLALGNIGDIYGFDISYGFIFAAAGSLEILVSQNYPTFSRVAETNGSLGPPSDELDNTKEDLFTFGAGVGWRSDLVQYLIPWDRFFDTFTFYLTYNRFKENFYEKEYSGLGFRVDYLLKYRLSKAFHFGLKMAYATAWTMRPEEEAGESTYDRRLTLGWMTMGLDIGLNF